MSDPVLENLLVSLSVVLLLALGFALARLAVAFDLWLTRRGL